eukprot:COSAG02_NODE_2879_length_7828_cov_3.672791_5_plen_520_part_00
MLITSMQLYRAVSSALRRRRAGAAAAAAAAAAAVGSAAAGTMVYSWPPVAHTQAGGKSRFRPTATAAASAGLAGVAVSGGVLGAASSAGNVSGKSVARSGSNNPLPLSPAHRQLALNLMDLLDENHDGALTFREVLKLTSMTEPHWSDGARLAKADDLLRSMDTDQDGKVGEIEFLCYIERQYETFEERRHLFAVVAAMDALHQFSRAQGYRHDNLRRATTIVQQLEIGHIATLVNAVIDLEHFDEDQEQEIFEDAVSQVLQVLDIALPHPYKQLVVSNNTGSPGLPDSSAEPLKLRLENFLERTLCIPCLEEPEERRVRTAVVEIVVESMKTGKSLQDVTDARRSGQLIMNIFIRGSLQQLQAGSASRGEVVNSVTSNISIPFVPAFLTQRCVEFCLERMESIVQEAINNVFNSHFEAAKSSTKAPETESLIQFDERDGTGDDYNHGRALQFHLEVQTELVALLLPHVAHLPVPAEWKRRWCESFVEHTILAIIDVDRLTDAMIYIVSKQREQDGTYV